MLIEEFKPDIIDLASIVSGRINKQDSEARKLAFNTLQTLLLEVKPVNIPINRPLSDYISNYVVSGIDWREIIEQFIDIRKGEKTKIKRKFRKVVHRAEGSIVLPLSDPNSYFELEKYDRKKTKIRYKKGSLILVDEGDKPYYKLGHISITDPSFEIESDSLIGNRLFFSRDMYEKEILSERNLFRRKLIFMLQIFASEVIKNIEVKF